MKAYPTTFGNGLTHSITKQSSSLLQPGIHSPLIQINPLKHLPSELHLLALTMSLRIVGRTGNVEEEVVVVVLVVVDGVGSC